MLFQKRSLKMSCACSLFITAVGYSSVLCISLSSSAFCALPLYDSKLDVYLDSGAKAKRLCSQPLASSRGNNADNSGSDIEQSMSGQHREKNTGKGHIKAVIIIKAASLALQGIANTQC